MLLRGNYLLVLCLNCDFKLIILPSSYRLEELMKFFNARRNAYQTDAKLIDEVLYTPYVYEPLSQTDTRHSKHKTDDNTGDLLGVPELLQTDDSGATPRPIKKKSKFNITASQAEIFLFSYGTVVIWGMTEVQEKRFLASMYVNNISELVSQCRAYVFL